MRILPLLPLLLAAPLAMAAPPEVTATPERVVLGKEREVTLRVRVPGNDGPVRAAASSGTFEQDTVTGGEERIFRWVPPDIRHPQMAVLLFWVEGGGAEEQPPEVARVLVPLLGRLSLDIATNPGAQVVVEVAHTRFGPVRANARGQAIVPVEVPPGVTHARVLATRGELHTDRITDIPVPPHQPLVAMLGPSPMPVEQGGWLVVAGAEDASPSSEDLELQVEGALTQPVEGPLTAFRVWPAEDATAVSVQVRHKTSESTASASVPVRPRPVVPPPEPPPVTVQPSGGLELHLLAGGILARGANTGLMAALGASYPLPVWHRRLAIELEVGLRQASLEAVDAFGMTRRSQVLAGPVLASARLAAFEHGAFSLYGRVGAGVMPFTHRLTIDFQNDAEESKLKPMAFLAAQAAYRFGVLSALVELRGAYGPARTPWLDAQLGGVAVTVGMRYAP